MQRTEATHQTNRVPATLLSAEQMAKVLGLTTEKLLEFVDAGYCPHWRLLDGPPLFATTEVKAWANRNLFKHEEGKDLERITVISPRPVESHKVPVPVELRSIANLCSLPELLSATITAVYFLCRGSEVLYVGQSTDVQSRICSHVKEGKIEFDAAYFLPVTRSSLDAIEAAFIKTLRPKYNGNAGPRLTAEQASQIVQEIAGIGLVLPQLDDQLIDSKPS